MHQPSVPFKAPFDLQSTLKSGRYLANDVQLPHCNSYVSCFHFFAQFILLLAGFYDCSRRQAAALPLTRANYMQIVQKVVAECQKQSPRTHGCITTKNAATKSARRADILQTESTIVTSFAFFSIKVYDCLCQSLSQQQYTPRYICTGYKTQERRPKVNSNNL